MSESQERNHSATPHKLREARKRGEVAKSIEATYALVLAAFLTVCMSVGPSLAQSELAIARRAMTGIAPGDWSVDYVAGWTVHLISACVQVLAPLFLALVCVIVIASVAQTGGVFSFVPLTPDFKRLNPAAGLKRLFSLRMLYEAARGLLKLAILTAIAWSAIRHAIPDLMKLGLVDARGHAAVVLSDFIPLLVKLLIGIVLIALIDILYTRWDYAKKMRMSHRDITDEHKQREGDPRVRNRHRQLRNELLQQSQSAARVPEADVLITNPTHIAIALSYQHGSMPAPKLLAKGRGEVAAQMRALARQHNIPVVENPPLARALFKRAHADQFVPEDLFPLVAKILVWVYAMDRTRNRGAAAPGGAS